MEPHIRPDLADLPAYVPGRSDPGAVKLASNETVHGPLPAVTEAIAAAVQTVNRYPDSGARQLTAALAEDYGLAPEQVAVGCGSVSLCQQLVQAACTPGAGHEVLFAWRSFEAYPIITQIAGAVPVTVPLGADHAHDLDAMAAAITERTRVVFVCNPNNPTGTVVGTAALERFLARVPKDVIVALDEAYIEYVRPGDGRTDAPEGDDLQIPDGLALAARHRNVVVLRTFSKAYGLAGMRVGYALGDPVVIAGLRKVFIPFSVSSPAQAAGLASLAAADELLARTDLVVAERTRMARALAEAGYTVAASGANFLWLPLAGDSPLFSDRCADAGVLVRPYGTDGVRVTVGDREENDAFLAFARADAGR